ncbi:MAG: hypothetical protein R3F53_22895 [Gammaproteobacteria bacterium]
MKAEIRSWVERIMRQHYRDDRRALLPFRKVGTAHQDEFCEQPKITRRRITTRFL